MKGQIRKALSGFYYIEADGQTWQTRGRGNFRNRNITPLVGDQVIFESSNLTDGYLLEILPRKNQLTRPPVANVDVGVIVISLVEPAFSYNLLDRFLVTLEDKDIQPVIYLSKLDLMTDDFLATEIKRVYEKIGYQVIATTNAAEAKSQLFQVFSGNLTVFMGQSGAGKSTLLNQLVPDLQLATGEISDALGRGRHTTRHVELISMAEGLVADTPGFSAIDFLEITSGQLSALFPEFDRAQAFCKFRECMHLKEPGCEVKRQVEAGEIATSRYEDYQQFVAEIEKRRPIYRKKK